MGVTPNVTIMGAGSIGCYVGGRLAASGTPVGFVGRQRLADELHRHGLHLTDYLGADLKVAAGEVRFSTTPEVAAQSALVLVTVKSAATEQAGHELAAVVSPGTVIISFQNGLHNAEVLRPLLPQCTVLTGMVPFNVVNLGQGAFHQGSEGQLDVQAHDALAPFLPAFARAGLPLHQHRDMAAVQWAKLLLNLNNAINALSNVPLKAELSQRGFRRCVALAQQEALALMTAAGIRPAKLTPLPPQWIPRLLSVPDPVFRVLGNQMITIDPKARSSMWEDLERGRPTEIDWLNGEVVKLAQHLGRTAPVNARLVELIREAELGRRHVWTADTLLAELQDAAGVTRAQTRGSVS
jgi:2-dehydropantoate 2-reductase